MYVATGTMRVLGNKHWGTDVLADRLNCLAPH